MERHEKIFAWGVTGILAMIALCVWALVLIGCTGSDGDRRTILPTVASESIETFVTCHDWDGIGPDKEFQRAKVDAVSGSKSPRFCFIGDVCFYGCPR